MTVRRPSLDLAALRARYAAGTLTPTTVVDEVLARIAVHDDPAVFIHLEPRERLLERARALEARGPAGLPLWGVPFAVKDNIDVAGMPTTAACPAFAYRPARSATVVERLVAAGAIPIGKTNMDQFATGLVGVRSPYGTPRNVLDATLIPGGSSSGSAVAVAAGMVSFALGTDTAGSGRVPAALGNVVGLKPTRGLLSTRGVVPACASLDCVSVFALSCDDAGDVVAVARGFDPDDPWSRQAPAAADDRPLGPRLGIPLPWQREFFGDTTLASAFEAAVARLAADGATLVEIDVEPFLDAARLLYEGPWLAERLLAVRDFMGAHAEAMHPVTRAVIAGGTRPTAVDAFAAQHRLRALSRRASAALAAVDALVLPTVGCLPTLREVAEDPLGPNARLGHYTNGVNLLDLAAVAVPGGFDARHRPCGLTLVGPAFAEARLLALGKSAHRTAGVTMGATGVPLPREREQVMNTADRVALAVCGAHMRGLPLEHEIVSRGGRWAGAMQTAPCYRLFALPGGPPARPGMIRDAAGTSIAVEVWELSVAGFGEFVAGVPVPLAIGTVELADGRRVKGFVCEPHAIGDAVEITHLGGWRAWLAALESSGKPGVMPA